MAEINLKDKFPELEPVAKPPSLWTVNGVGLGIVGARDKDAETQTYIKTHVFKFLFVPIFALGAYRVAKATGSRWYFIGREPLSALAKAWNAAIIVALCAGISYGVWNAKYNSPGAVADRKLAAAEKMIDEGKLVDAAMAYQSVSNGPSDRSDAARATLVRMHQLPAMASAPLGDVAEVLRLELATRPDTNGDPVGKSVFDTAMKLVEQRGANDLQGANQIFHAVRPVVDDEERFNASRQSILEKLVAAEPDNLLYASELAQSFEQQGELERCKELLTPHADKLAATEGARILGQIWAGEDQFDKSFQLLDPYCETRLADLNQAEDAFRATVEQEQQRLISELERGKGPKSFYSQYDRADEARQQTLVDEYLSGKLEHSQAIDRARQVYADKTKIVPVALDLGMVRLRRAQAIADADDRRTELNAAEKTFKSIRSVAGDSDEYRLYMGQVSYWLGNYDEGRELFDGLLDSNGRTHSILLAVAGMVREVGRSAEARKLVEEAYDNADNPAERRQAAMMRSSMMTDNEDQLKWLKRSDLTEPSVNASYQSAQATKAFIAGDFKTAKKSFRESIAAYDQTTETVGMLNNSGLTCFALYRVTRDQADFDEGLRRIEKAIALSPSDSILRTNASHILLSAAYGDLLNGHVDLTKLKADPSRDMLAALYSDAIEERAVVEQLRNHKGAQRAVELLNNVALLAPKSTDAYATLLTVHDFQKDIAALKKLRDQVVAAEPEIDLTETLSFYAGDNDEKFLTAINAGIERVEQGLQETEPGSQTRSILVDRLVTFHLQRSAIEPMTDLDRLVDLASEVFRSTPSSSSRWTLQNVLAARAHERLSQSNENYRALADRSRRTLFPQTVLGIAATRDEAFSQIVHQDADVVEMMKLLRTSLKAFPDNLDSWQWAMLLHADPATAAKIAESLRANEQLGLVRQIEAVLTPASLSDAVRSAWVDTATGNDEAAQAVLQRCADLGVPLPFDVSK